ncbi:hypothetical protein OZX56_08310 [Lactobacillus sp. ESL0684]|uniref:hypothetical protein n=1 Tax=Lactobacillus sp. ESL0684 TaxID=2983213 RepID=UPI0023F80EBC|nr:hypothetical protein [Lactobacillus sp. ESL0684]WEV43495.1 hypothetical protein OZX56_08310 [Lactobacillus sp. ESL0684]
MQQMRDFDLDGRLRIIFKSLKYNQIAYTFSFSNCSRYIGTKVCDGLYYNHVIFELGKRYLEELSGWQVKTAASDSMIDQQAFFMPHPTFEHLSLQQLSSDLLNKQHLRYGQQLAAYYELTFVIKDHQTIYGLSKRRDTFF